MEKQKKPVAVRQPRGAAKAGVPVRTGVQKAWPVAPRSCLQNHVAQVASRHAHTPHPPVSST